MRKRIEMKPLLTILCLLAAALSSAQGLLSRIPPAMPPFTLLMNPSIRFELKVSPRQAARIDEVLETVAAPGGKGIMIRPTTDLAALGREATESLSPTQRRRLRELWVQREGGLTLLDDGVAQELGLSPTQRKRAREIYDEMIGTLRTSVAPSGGEPKRVDTRSRRAAAGKQAVALLSAAQKARFERMKGKPFRFVS